MKNPKSVCSVIAFVLAAAVSAGFALGVFDGDGISRVQDRDYDEFIFAGSLRNGRFTGYGSMLFLSGERYSGNFSAGRFHGEGRLYCSAENWNFDGIFQEGRATAGTFYDYTGQTVAYERGENADSFTGYTWKYEGGLNEHGQNGFGTFIFPGGSAYSGGFARGLAEGEGAYTDASGKTVYTGGFLEGKFNGRGVYISAEGWIYEGGFLDGLFHGEGVLTAGTDAVRGVWENGIQVVRYD